MKVSTLITILSQLDKDAEVFVMMQPNWPFECALEGVATRKDLCDDEETPEPLTQGRKSNDVFLVEGAQLRYGSKRAWGVARKEG